MENPSYTIDLTDPKDIRNGFKNGGINNVMIKNGINGKRKVKPQEAEKQVVAVLGSGDFGRAISSRLVNSGYRVYIGSRDPNRSTVKQLVRKTGATLVNQDAAASSCDIVLVAVGRDHYDNLPFPLLKGKILIDVSNNTERRKGPLRMSNAEYLQSLVPDATVVKAFNVLSAYALENGGQQGSKEVYMASDYLAAKEKVSVIIRVMGFIPVDWGGLSAARDIEDVPLKLMPSWKRPVAVVFGLFIFHWTLAFFQFQICSNISSGNWSQNWQNLGMQNFNRVLGIMALWTLSFCYLPGLIASYIQLWRGTKYSRFPKWLDDWLKMRKQLGLLMLGMAAVHGCLSLGHLAPQTTSWVYEPPQILEVQVVAQSGLTKTQKIQIDNFHFNWQGELFLTMAALAMCLTIVLGITSLPSVTATLSWREFTFIQSKLGWVTLIISSLHDIFLAYNFMFLYWGCFNTLPIGPQYALYPPFLCIVLKLPLLIPPIDRYLMKIRRGYERHPTLKNCNKVQAIEA